jgi:hypothetical protein
LRRGNVVIGANLSFNQVDGKDVLQLGYPSISNETATHGCLLKISLITKTAFIAAEAKGFLIKKTLPSVSRRDLHER